MNKERYNQIIDDAYKNYVSTYENFEWTDDFCKKNLKDYGDQWDVFSQEEFISKCKTDAEFSEKWGLKIEERELSDEERIDVAIKTGCDSFDLDIAMGNSENALSDYGIPTKLITVTYNNETIESYD